MNSVFGKNLFLVAEVFKISDKGTFGEMVFNETVMQDRLTKDIYKTLKKTISNGKQLDINVANAVANAMKVWAIEKGATHFSHWFQPMTGVTAEKHDSFAVLDSENKVLHEFSGNALVKGESDASSFPSGGLRATFEARGYTAWDPTSYAFVKDGTLYIPTAFCSYGGEALDKKTPLLRSMEALDKQAKRILKLFGNENIKRVTPNVGAEQEYFLIDKEVFLKRPDLIYTGRTLFGAKPPKGQELDDHYFGLIKPRVANFMKEVDEKLWSLGVLSKTRHNETAPSQHELAVLHSSVNVASDQNQLTMELLKTIADKHGMVCLLHEKPFMRVNGSGKHNNWSLITNEGVNLFEPGETPHDNAQFLLFLMSVLKSVDEYQDLLNVSITSAGNDHRLGGNEAPPTIVSVYLGDKLMEILDAIENGTAYDDKGTQNLKVGVHVLPEFPKDTTDRNRTSPFAFTGNKFEFRMLGSSFSIAGSNIMLNTIVAEALEQFANVLEKSDNFNDDLQTLIKDTLKKHKRILFNGNNYSEEWIVEAEKRGLLNPKYTPDILPNFILEKNIKLFEKHKVLSKSEVHSRFEILASNYCNIIKIEGLTLIDITKKYVIPSVAEYQNELAKTIQNKRLLGLDLNTELEENLLNVICSLGKEVYPLLEDLKNGTKEIDNCAYVTEKMHFAKNNILFVMNALRLVIDELESNVGRKYWSLPTYMEILSSVI